MSFGRRIGAQLLAEGIERRADLAAPDGARRRARPGLPARQAGPGAGGRHGGSTSARAPRPRRPGPRRTAATHARSAYHRGHDRSHRDPGIRHQRPSPVPSPTTSGPSSTTCATRRSPPIDPDGGPRQAVVWYTVDGDEIVINSAIGRRWPTNLLRDPRLSFAVIDAADGYRWVGLTGTVRVDHRLGDDAGRHRGDGPPLPRRRARRGRAARSASASSARTGSPSGSAPTTIHDELDG